MRFLLRLTGDMHAEPYDMIMSSAAAMYIYGRLRYAYGHQHVVEELSHKLGGTNDHGRFQMSLCWEDCKGFKV